MTKKQSIEYANNYTTFSREELVEQVEKRMSKKRFNHTLRVEETALKLADRYGADKEKVSIAALVHDVAKDEPEGEMMDLVISENLDLDLLQYGQAIWHAPAGVIQAQRDFDIEDEEILAAIRNHTVAAPDMSMVEQIIYVADFIEPERRFEGIERARQLAKDDLTEAVKYIITETMIHLVQEKRKIYPKAIDSYNAWVAK